MPIYYEKASVFAAPYLELMWQKLVLLGLFAAKQTENTRTWLNENIPVLLHWVSTARCLSLVIQQCLLPSHPLWGRGHATLFVNLVKSLLSLGPLQAVSRLSSHQLHVDFSLILPPTYLPCSLFQLPVLAHSVYRMSLALCSHYHIFICFCVPFYTTFHFTTATFLTVKYVDVIPVQLVYLGLNEL